MNFIYPIQTKSVLLFIDHSFIQQISMEGLICGWYCPRPQGYSDEQTQTVSAHVEFIVWRGTQTSIGYHTLKVAVLPSPWRRGIWCECILGRFDRVMAVREGMLPQRSDLTEIWRMNQIVRGKGGNTWCKVPLTGEAKASMSVLCRAGVRGATQT